MSGHNKWSKIKHKKAATDAVKSKIFSKLVRLITVEAKLSGGDTNSPGLRMAMDKARAANMPSDNIDRAIKKANESSENMENVTYEAYGPGGVGLIIEGLTSNRNKAAAEIRHILSKNNASLGAQGSVSWGFTKENMEWKPSTTIDLSDEDLEKLSKLVDALEDNDEVQEVFTNAE
ncbi:YebC/PmpR family DNA-binding transcriptional regulator [Candidatus Wolfebacteria bacterium]|nr:MAG: YebC/PmpR family DNA-binding transcriptional regulator [Candidatus Wolfebacteria bacterium]